LVVEAAARRVNSVKTPGSTVDYEKLTFSMSRIKTAICARFAASATNVKSLRKVSVEAGLICLGRGGAMWAEGDWRVDDIMDVCCVVGEEMGAFILGEGSRFRERGK